MSGTSTSVDAIVVLGCRVLGPDRLSLAAARRVERAARAYHDGVAPVVIASGGRTWSGVPEATAMRDALVRRGIPDRAVWLELSSLTTVENAIFTTAIARRRFGRAALAVVTSTFHLPRALDDFTRCGARVLGLSAADPVPTLGAEMVRAVKERLRSHLDRGILARSGPAGSHYLGTPLPGDDA